MRILFISALIIISSCRKEEFQELEVRHAKFEWKFQGTYAGHLNIYQDSSLWSSDSALVHYTENSGEIEYSCELLTGGWLPTMGEGICISESLTPELDSIYFKDPHYYQTIFDGNKILSGWYEVNHVTDTTLSFQCVLELWDRIYRYDLVKL